MRALWRIVSSLKTSLVLMAVLAALLLLSVALPQERLLGEQGIAAAADSWIERTLLIDLGFAAMPTSPVFIAALCMFFANLIAVMTRRLGSTLKRIRRRSLSAAQLDRRAASKDALRLPRPATWQGAAARSLLKKLGYEISQPADHGLFAEKNRTGLLGFLVFHLSFFPIVAGGLMLYYTRFEATAVLIEGQAYDPAKANVLRHAPLGDADGLAFTLVEVDPAHERGLPVRLAVAVETTDGARTVRRRAEVNDPAEIGDVDLLVDRVGLAPVLELLDRRGDVVDLVAVPAPLSRADVSLVPIGTAGHELELDPVPIDERFPDRARLGATTVELRVFRGADELYSGGLRPGEVAPLGDFALRLREVRYWTNVHVVAERGGWLLIAGFALAVIGLVWRLLFVRREIGVVWYDDEVVLFGRSEFYRGRFRDDLEALGAILVDPTAPLEEVDS